MMMQFSSSQNPAKCEPEITKFKEKQYEFNNKRNTE